MKWQKTGANTRSTYPISQVRQLHLIVPIPKFNPDTINWLQSIGIDYERILIELFLALTPEGIEEEYFGVFEDFQRNSEWAYGDPNSMRLREVSEELINTAIAQYVYSPAFEYVIRGDVVDINVDRETVQLTVRYSED